ncbi:MAG: DMT family transporter [Pirellulaceae bacterium]
MKSELVEAATSNEACLSGVAYPSEPASDVAAHTAPTSKSVASGRVLIALAAVLWSTSGFFVKAPWFDAWPADVRGVMLAFWRSFFAVLILAPLIRRPSLHWQLLPMSVCFAVMVWSFMAAMVHGPAANAIWLQYLAPAWVFLGGLWLLKEKATMPDIRMLAFCLSGVLLILSMEMLGGRSPYATAMGLLSGVAFAGVVLALRACPGVDSAWSMTLNHLATVLLLSPWVWQHASAAGSAAVSWNAYFALALFGILQISLPYLMFARGLRTTNSLEASALTLIEPILVPIWVYLAWHHHPSYDAPRWWTWAGGLLILVGLLSRYLPPLLRTWYLASASPRNVTG